MGYDVTYSTIEAGNCVLCGKHLDNDDGVFLCKECRRKEETERCQRGKLKAVGIGMERPGKSTTAKGPKQKPNDRVGQ